MPRLPLREPEDAPEQIREVLEAVPLSLLGVIAHAESAFEPWLKYSNTLLRRLDLDPLLRELAILQVAHLSASEYEWSQHVPIAETCGALPVQIAAIAAGTPDDESLNETEGLVLEFTREVVLDGAAGERLLGELRERLGVRQVVELLLVIGNYLGLARLIATVGLEPHEAVVKLPPPSS